MRTRRASSIEIQKSLSNQEAPKEKGVKRKLPLDDKSDKEGKTEAQATKKRRVQPVPIPSPETKPAQELKARSRTELFLLSQGESAGRPVEREGRVYQLLESHTAISQGNYYCGGANREMILLAMNNEELFKFYKTFIRSFQESEAATPVWENDKYVAEESVSSAPEVLEITPNLLNYLVDYVNIFFQHSSNEKVLHLLEAYNKEKVPLNKLIVPLDLFVTHKIGVCRHLSLLTAYVLAKLTEPHPEAGYQVFRCRTTLKRLKDFAGGAHAVTVLKDAKNHYYLLDSTLKLFIDLSQSKESRILPKSVQKYDLDSFIADVLSLCHKAERQQQYLVLQKSEPYDPSKYKRHHP